jgi:L-lactate dehydrogenase complex protein LldE
MRVALFVTCLTDTFYPRTGIAMVKVLEHLGCTVEFPQDQTCCGQPMWNNGFHPETRKLARRMCDVFADAEYVVTPSGSCAAMVRDYYPHMFAPPAPPGTGASEDRGISEPDPEAHAAAVTLAGKTHEFVEFLLGVLKFDPAQAGVKWDGEVTYHYSCHLRGLGITDEAVRVMDGVDGLKHVPLKKADQCCGFGGTFAMKYPAVSGAMVRDKVGCIAQSKAPTCISNDAGCTMNIAGACRREGVDVEFKSLAEVLAEGLGLMERGD